jgi:hypothetical protein
MARGSSARAFSVPFLLVLSFLLSLHLLHARHLTTIFLRLDISRPAEVAQFEDAVPCPCPNKPTIRCIGIGEKMAPDQLIKRSALLCLV